MGRPHSVRISLQLFSELSCSLKRATLFAGRDERQVASPSKREPWARESGLGLLCCPLARLCAAREPEVVRRSAVDAHLSEPVPSPPFLRDSPSFWSRSRAGQVVERRSRWSRSRWKDGCGC